jgi:hypothetical protein
VRKNESIHQKGLEETAQAEQGYQGARKGEFLAKPIYPGMPENPSRNHPVLASPGGAS